MNPSSKMGIFQITMAYRNVKKFLNLLLHFIGTRKRLIFAPVSQDATNICPYHPPTLLVTFRVTF